AAIAALAIPGDGTELMLGILGSSAYAMLILTMATAWESDISYHYIYLIPATPFMKMLASTLTGVIYTLIEGILVFGIIGVILRAPLSLTLSAILAYTAIGTVFLYSDLVVRRMFGKIHANVLRIFFRIFLLVVIIAIAVTPAVIISLTTGNYALGLCTSAAVNIVLILLFMWIGTGLFVSPELP
ncbi:MAG: putative ABC exporter domain-containing protein, partial [Caldicoprobacterales bacterium]